METSPRLLAVDDSATIRKAFELILAPAGYILEFAATAAEGLAKARALQPSVVLLDFILPDMRGSEVARELLLDARTAHLPVVLISTKGAEIRQAYQDIPNVVAYITKPFTPDQVLNAVSEVLAHVSEAGFFKHAALASPPDQGEAGTTPSVTHTAPQPNPTDAAHLAGPTTRDESWTDIDDGAVDDEDEVRTSPSGSPAARASLERMFETLLAGLEGVYVEEIDTPTGAVADQAKSYTDLASRLTRQLDETLEHAKSGARFGLCSDGSVQSLADMLLDTHRRVCRLLFRAVAAGAVDTELAGRSRARVLVVRHPDGEAVEQLLAPGGDAADWHVFSVASDFRQLPLMTRLFGPTHLIVETAQHAALWDQLRLVRALPEGRRLEILGIMSTSAAVKAVDAATLAELGISTVVDSGRDLRNVLRARIGGSSPHASRRETLSDLAISSDQSCPEAPRRGERAIEEPLPAGPPPDGPPPLHPETNSGAASLS